MKSTFREITWAKPKTAMYYLHPPFSSRLVMLWADFKITDGEIKETTRVGAEGNGFIFQFGAERKQLDFNNTVAKWDRFYPCFTLTNHYNGLKVELVAFCGMDKTPETHFKLTITNITNTPITDSFTVMARTGMETLMFGMRDDGYCTYDPPIEMWGMIPDDYICSADTLKNSKYALKFATENLKGIMVDESKNMLHKRGGKTYEFTLLPKEKATLSGVAFSREIENDFKASYQKFCSGWDEYIKLIKVPDYVCFADKKLIKRLGVGTLQMFATESEKNYVYLRQGGNQRGYWPTEAIKTMDGLKKIGLEKYCEQIYEFFCEYQLKSGENAGKFICHNSPDWACITGSVLSGLSRHIMALNDIRLYKKYRQNLRLAYEYIENMRNNSCFKTGEIKGLFPSMRSTDWDLVSQAMFTTDGWSCGGEIEYQKLLLQFGDEIMAKKVGKSIEDYREIIMREIDSQLSKQKVKDEIVFSTTARGDIVDPPIGPYFYEVLTLFISGILDVNSDIVSKMENYFVNRKLFVDGLKGRMTDSPILWDKSDRHAGNTYYVVHPELAWYDIYMARGEYCKAKECVQAVRKYAVTKESYVHERYSSIDPFYVPWQPNASGNAAVISMLLDYNKNIDKF